MAAVRFVDSPMRQLAILAGVALLTVACGAEGIEAPESADRDDQRTDEVVGVPPGPGGYRGELTDWEPCEGGFECARLAVPVEWDDPGGDTVDLAVIRKPADGDASGSVVFNPGGPGGSGKQFLVDFTTADRLPEGLDEEFDLVSWDPRGTGESDPIDCTTEAEITDPDIDPTPDTLEQAAAIEAEHAEQLAECLEQEGEWFADVGTADSARDLDALRYALGEDQLTYVGYSYGSALGMEYARQFPEHVRALVLDGVSAPGEDQVETTRFQGQAFERNLEDFLADCADREDRCDFGGGDPRQALLDLIAELERGRRIPAEYSFDELERTGTVGIGELYAALAQAMYERELWPVLEMGLANAADPSDPNAGILLLLRDLLAGRGEDGEWNPIGDANAAISCADTEVRAASPVGDPAVRTRFTAELPLLGGFFASGTPGCSGFPPAEEPLAPAAAADFAELPPVVVISTTGDPATPYQAGVDAQRLLPGSVLVTYEDAVHTAYGRGADCLDDPVTDYLVTLELPEDGIRCEP